MIRHLEAKKIPRSIYLYNNILLLYTIVFFIICALLSYNYEISDNITCSDVSKKISFYAAKFDKASLCNADAIFNFNRLLVTFGIIVSFIFVFVLNVFFRFTVCRFEIGFFDHVNPLMWKKEKFISVAFLTSVLLFSYIQYSFKRFYIFKSENHKKSIELMIFDESLSFILFFYFFFVVNFLILFGRNRSQDRS